MTTLTNFFFYIFIGFMIIINNQIFNLYGFNGPFLFCIYLKSYFLESGGQVKCLVKFRSTYYWLEFIKNSKHSNKSFRQNCKWIEVYIPHIWCIWCWNLPQVLEEKTIFHHRCSLQESVNVFFTSSFMKQNNRKDARNIGNGTKFIQ